MVHNEPHHFHCSPVPDLLQWRGNHRHYQSEQDDREERLIRRLKRTGLVIRSPATALKVPARCPVRQTFRTLNNILTVSVICVHQTRHHGVYEDQHQ